MTGASDAQRGRIIALGILLLVGVAVWLGPVSAYFDMLNNGAETLASRNALLQRYRTLAAAPIEPAPPPRPASNRTSLFSDAPEAQALALLQESVKAAATANRIQVQSLLVLRSENVGEASKIGVRMRAAGDIASLGQFLHAVETARPVLYPDNLQIQAPPSVQGAAAGNLEFQLDVSGFRAGAAS